MKSFLNYYHDELLFLRQKGGSFAKAHPEIAERLDIKNGQSTDPQTERIIESVAFMAAKLNQKIDDNAQNIAFHLLSALYPNLINTFPPCGVVKFETDESVLISDNISVAKGTNLFVKARSGNECQFKTIYPLTLYPLKISGINLQKTGGDDGWAFEINIKTTSVPIELISPNDILFYINSEVPDQALVIYESLFSKANRDIFLKVRDTQVKLPPQNLVQCGFDDSESVCPVTPYSTNSFQLFQEMLHFRKKFMFFRVFGIGETINSLGLESIDEFSIIIDAKLTTERLFEVVKDDSIILNSAPIVNLFNVTSDPFKFDGTSSKYLLLADQTRDSSIEIHSVSELHIIDDRTKEDKIVQPYFSLAIDSDTNIIHDLYWLHSKESSQLRNLDGFDTYISFVDTKMNPYNIYADVVYAKTLCTNRYATRDISTSSKMYIDSIETGGYYAKLLHKTTEPVSFSENTSSLWNLISQLTATHMSVSKAGNLMDSLRKISDLFSSSNRLKVDELFEGIKKVEVREIVQRFGKDAWRGFVKGKEITFEVAEESSFFTYFLGCIVNQYLSDIISINSFIKLVMKSTINGKTLATWNATSGKRDLI